MKMYTFAEAQKQTQNKPNQTQFKPNLRNAKNERKESINKAL